MNEHDEIDGLAAEFVLGTLSHEERMAVERQRIAAPALENAILAWEKRLAPLIDAMPEVPPSQNVFTEIEKRINGENVVALPSMPDHARLVRQVRMWKRLALAASILFVGLAAVALNQIPQSPVPPRMVAVLQKDSAAPAFLISFNERDAALSIQPFTAQAPSGKSYELWIIEKGRAAPRSLGVITKKEMTLHPKLDPAAVRDATLAVSIEPAGGSPTGAPTGPVLFTGKFVEASL